MNLQKIAIVGASGYSGEELLRLLSRHPGVELAAVTSRQSTGRRLAAVYPRFAGTRFAEHAFSDSTISSILAAEPAIALLALPHGLAAEFAGPLLDAGVRVIDLSADFRIKNVAVYEDYYGEPHALPALAEESVYGMPEIYRDQIRAARLIACPGCYPTSIILPLFPLMKQRLLDAKTVVVTSVSGVSGAGRTTKVEFLFAECNESMRAYGVPKHRHLAEIEQELSLAYGEEVIINFAPHLIPVTRGIHTTIHASPNADVDPEDIDRTLVDAFEAEPFVRVLGRTGFPDTKQVTHTNFLDVGWRHDPRTQRLILFSAEDNLVKGAAGQAVQCLNIMCGWPETTALL